MFVSHAHRDHCSDAALGLIERGRARGVVAFDVRRKGPWHRIWPGDRLDAGGVSVRAFRSTDAGVSFLAEAGGLRVFHAGDLNFWHWREESTGAEVEEARRAFDRAVSEIEGEAVDVAFFPVDPRMAGGYDEGALEFAGRVRPRVVIRCTSGTDPTRPRVLRKVDARRRPRRLPDRAGRFLPLGRLTIRCRAAAESGR